MKKYSFLTKLKKRIYWLLSSYIRFIHNVLYYRNIYIENAEKFLMSMCEQGESCLQPSFFINSTHNTIGANIAILTGNHGYNNTHVHREISFENAPLDALLPFVQGKINSALVGAFNEMTEKWHQFFGNSFTASAFGFYFSFECLEKGYTPNGSKNNNILIYNSFNIFKHSLILLSR